MGRQARLIAGSAGVAAAIFGAATVALSPRGVPPGGVLTSPAAALVPAGLALLAQVLPVYHRIAGRILLGLAPLLALAATAIAVAALDPQPHGAVVALVTIAVLMTGGSLVRSLDAAEQRRRRLTDELRDRQQFADSLRLSMTDATAALTSHAADLEHGNGRLRESNARLEAALAFKNDLTSMLTHDMAQPISSIASLAELLRADWADLPDDIRLELATKIDKNTQRLIKMMNDLQLLFRLDTGTVTARRVPVPLLEVAESVVAGSVVAAADVEIAIGEELSALADRGHLTVVVQNLMTNAIAYGAPPFRISAQRSGDTVELAVQDSGPGIPDELLTKLFDRFMRGSGLGLFIVRHLVEANGGSVRYEPATPQGARLIVRLETAPI
ncbi:MAG: HAMP domain-containing sensor histidine kinase [Actinoplanes sp.]